MKHQIRIASPCHASWTGMSGDARVRHCGECKLDVFNFSEMSEREIERLVESRQGRLCARYYQRPDGTMLTKNCPTGFRASLLRAARVTSAALAAVISIVPGLAANATSGPLGAYPRNTALQQIQAAPTGVVVRLTDPSTAVISGAVVRFIDEKTGQTVEGVTNRDGIFRADEVPPGNYRMIVDAKGFEQVEREHVQLPSRVPFELQLQLGVLMGEVVSVLNTEPPTLEQSLVPRNLAPFEPADSVALMKPPAPGTQVSLAVEINDPNGAAVKDATVTLINETTRAVVHAKTDSTGQLRFANLPDGRYGISAAAPGFASSYQNHVVVPAASPMALNLKYVAEPRTPTVAPAVKPQR
jgi:Carboxypeptidase regulatory-like domain